MSSQGPSRRGTADDSWWDEVYGGPAGTSPDVGGRAPTPGTVDDWFTTATDAITGPRRPDPGADEPGAPEDGVSVDDWFSTANAAIGGETQSPAGGAREAAKPPAEWRPGTVDDWFDSATTAIGASPPAVPDPTLRLTRRAPRPRLIDPVDPVDLVESFDLPRRQSGVEDDRPPAERPDAPGADGAAPEERRAGAGDGGAVRPAPSAADVADGPAAVEGGAESDAGAQAGTGTHSPDEALSGEALSGEASQDGPGSAPGDEGSANAPGAGSGDTGAGSAAAERRGEAPGVGPDGVPGAESGVFPPAPDSAAGPEAAGDGSDSVSLTKRRRPAGAHEPTLADARSAGSGLAGRQAGSAAEVVGLPYVGLRPPTYDPDPTALPAADPERLRAVVPDTVVDGARYGVLTVRAASVRGDSARFRGEPRRDHLLISRFGTGRQALLLVAVASAPRPAGLAPETDLPGEACRRLATAVGRSRPEVVADLREGARESLRYGLQRFAALAAHHLPEPPPLEPEQEPGPDPEAVSSPPIRPAGLQALLVPLDPEVRLRVAFGTGPGALLLHHPGRTESQAEPWSDLDADVADGAAFRFRAVAAEPGDVLLLCSVGLAQPLGAAPAAGRYLAECWGERPPGMVDFLRQMQVRVKGHAEDRTAVVLWEG